MLKKYNELREVEKEKVKLMYSDKDTLEMYLYNFDENGQYHGRQYTPPVGVIHVESTIPDVSKNVISESGDEDQLVRGYSSDVKAESVVSELDELVEGVKEKMSHRKSKKK